MPKFVVEATARVSGFWHLRSDSERGNVAAGFGSLKT